MSPSSTSTGASSSLIPTPLSLDSPPTSTTITISSPSPPPQPRSPPHTAGPSSSLHPAQSASAPSSSASSLGRSKSASRSRNNLGSLGRISTDPEGWKRTGDSLGRKKVRTRPPFAEHERDSPPTSPKSLLPVSSSSTLPRSSPAQTFDHPNQHPHEPSQASSASPFHTLERTISPLQLSLPESFPPQPIQPKQGRQTAEPRVVRPGDNYSDEEDLDVEKAQSPEGKRHEWWLLNKGKAALYSGRRVVAFGLEQQHSYFPDTSISAGDHTSSLPTTATTASSSYPSSPALPPLPLPHPRSSIEEQQSTPGSTNPNTPQRPAKTRRSSHFPSFHIPLPRLDLSNPYSAHQSKTPGWEEPYSSAPFLPVDPEGEEAKRRTRLERAGHWLLYSYWTPLVLRALNFALTAGTMGVGIKIRASEAGLGKQGITGSSPVVAIIYTPITLLHVLVAVYLEYFGRPVGLWSLSSKLLFTSLDLLSISLWSSLLSLSLSDLLSTPLTCVSESARWWTTVPVENIDFNGDHNVCSYQIALVVTVAVGTVGFLVNFFVSLGRVLAKVLGRRR